MSRASSPGAHQYQSIREYLCHGPPIFMNYDEVQQSWWPNYERMVDKILQDPETAQWLDCALNSDWGKSAGEQLRHERCGKGADDETTWLFKAKKKLHRLVPGIVLLFWILHITAALAFPLIVHNSTLNGSSGPAVDPFITGWVP